MSINKLLHKIYYQFMPYLESGLIEHYDEDANRFILQALRENDTQGGRGLMIAKFGTTELSAVITYLYQKREKPAVSFFDIIRRNRFRFSMKGEINRLCTNAGMFPATEEETCNLCRRYIHDLYEIDILGSYQRKELLLAHDMKCRYVNLNGFYAPFLYDEPWTQWLEGKRVIVVSSFEESIRRQYENRRTHLFENPKVLPAFASLKVIKAVQTSAGNRDSRFATWSEALSYMEKQIDEAGDYDVALIGCGAYGMPLAAHVKEMGKVGIHLGGWIQMLFGVYGNRWIADQPEFGRFINEYWIRPTAEERPENAKAVENGCYW